MPSSLLPKCKLQVTLMEPLGFDGGILISVPHCSHVSSFPFNKAAACGVKAVLPQVLFDAKLIALTE